MARRKRVEAPTADELKALEDGFAAKPSAGARPPIAQVAAEAATLAQPVSSEDRADAERFRVAEAEGRVVHNLPISEIVVEELTRDRTVVDAEAMEELKTSIAEHGQRHPIDVMRLDKGGYGLLSGYRRLKVISDLYGSDATIRASIQKPKDVTEAYVAMVEENEIRSNLSHYERGRIAVLAAGQGVFLNTTVAVQVLFASGSKAKRSKIRSFAMIHEELGDLLTFPEALSERAGLRLAAALREGHGGRLRDAVARFSATDNVQEWAFLSAALDEVETKRAPRQSTARVAAGRPRANDRNLGEPWELANGVTMVRERDQHGYAIRLDGPHVDEEFIETVMSTVHGLLRQE